MQDTKLRFISDPGHGWLEVPRESLNALGVLWQVSGYSYQYRNMVYLEEDRDAPLFLRETLNAGKPVIVDEVFQDPCPIRGYDSLQVRGDTGKQDTLNRMRSTDRILSTEKAFRRDFSKAREGV
jgi:hypothetical protein